MVENLVGLLEPISKVFQAIINPIETFNSFLNIVMVYIPYVAQTMLMFYFVTKSQKILSVMFLLITLYLLLKVAIALESTIFIAILLATVILIRLLGVSV